jgi:hypothetical protein
MLNNIMNNIIKTKSSKGGNRPGAGRPKGSKATITIQGLLDEITHQTGVDYDEVLVTDFQAARNRGDNHLVMKYHNLILNKVMNTLTKIEITDSAEVLDAKKAAFADALQKLTGIKVDLNATNEK